MGRRGVALFGLALGLAACAGPSETTAPPEAPVAWSDDPWVRAQQQGALFRAVGNEPGWLVDIFPDRLVYTADYGEAVYDFDDVTTSEANGITVYTAASSEHAFAMTRADEPCTDVMSGEPFEATVTVTLDGQTYRGCGRALGDG